MVQETVRMEQEVKVKMAETLEIRERDPLVNIKTTLSNAHAHIVILNGNIIRNVESYKGLHKTNIVKLNKNRKKAHISHNYVIEQLCESEHALLCPKSLKIKTKTSR